MGLKHRTLKGTGPWHFLRTIGRNAAIATVRSSVPPSKNRRGVMKNRRPAKLMLLTEQRCQPTLTWPFNQSPQRIIDMAKKQKKLEDSFVFFDVTYSDGTRSSRRKINATGLAKDEIEDFARTEIMTQDRRITEMSGKERGPIQELVRSDV